MLKSLEIRSLFLNCRLASTISASLRIARERPDWKWKKKNNRSWSWERWASGSLLGFSLITTIKDVFGHKPFLLEETELKEKVKKACLARKNRKFPEAILLLQEALDMAVEEGAQLPISRVYNELAETYYEMGELAEAEKLFRLLIHRLMELHEKRESAPEFIEISLKLSDIFARKGELDSAEAGYMHCVTRQMKVLEEHLRKYLVSHGARISGEHPVEIHGEAYTDPLALFGMCLEQYAFFLVNYRDTSRLEESEECINEALKVSNQIYGAVSFHMVNLLNNYGIALISAKQYEAAKKYLSLGITKVVQIEECSTLIPGYYCNYAEALFHCGQIDEALDYARRAVKLSNHSDEKLQNYARNFLHDLESDAKRIKRKKGS